ncbi:MAG: hypothetical protein ACOCUR_02150 [Nanoarchaeota archaeon]
MREEKIKHLGKIVGKINEKNEFVSVRRSEHFFRKFNGFGISFLVIERLKAKNVEVVKIIFQKKDGTAELYETELDSFLSKGKFYRDLEGDYQKILAINHFNKQA